MGHAAGSCPVISRDSYSISVVGIPWLLTYEMFEWAIVRFDIDSAG